MDLPAQGFANTANDRTAVDHIDVERAAVKGEIGHHVNFRAALKLDAGADVDFKWFNLGLAKKA